MAEYSNSEMQNNEIQRNARENERINNENERITSEIERDAREKIRIEKEIERQNNEKKRQEILKETDVDKLINTSERLDEVEKDLDNIEKDLDNIEKDLDNVNSQLAHIENNKADKVFSSVKDFGAIGDGITDDTQAIQNCINNSSAIKFESKEYRITSNIIVIENKIVDLNGATIIYDSTTWKPIFNIQGSNVKIVNGTLINKNGANCYMGIGVNINGTNDNRLYNMTFENLTMRNMVIWTPNPVNALGSGIYANFTNNMIIRNVKVYDVQGFGVHFGRCNDCVVDSCYVENVYGHAYSFSGEDYVCENCKLINSTGRNTGFAGIDLEGGKNCSVCNNTFENIGFYDDTIAENNLQSAIVYATLGTNNAIVSDNIIKNVKWGGILVPTIANEDPHKVVIKGNVIENAIKFGINVGYNANRTNTNCWWIVSDNIIYNSDIGISGGYILYNAIISSNFIDTCSEGIKGYFTSSDITDNRIHNFTTNGMFLNWFDNGNINNNTLVSDSSITSTVRGINIDRSTGHIYNTCVLNNNIKLRNSNDFGVRLYAYGGVTDLVINNNLVNSDNLIRSFYIDVQGALTRVYVSDGKGKIRDMSTGTWN